MHEEKPGDVYSRKAVLCCGVGESAWLRTHGMLSDKKQKKKRASSICAIEWTP